MTNAEKLAKNTEFLADVLSKFDCISCGLIEFNGQCCNKERLKEWLESEAKEDET